MSRCHTDLPVKLFVSVGELEDLAYPVKEGRDDPELEMEVRIIGGEDHVKGIPRSDPMTWAETTHPATLSIRTVKDPPSGGGVFFFRPLDLISGE